MSPEGRLRLRIAATAVAVLVIFHWSAYVLWDARTSNGWISTIIGYGALAYFVGILLFRRESATAKMDKVIWFGSWLGVAHVVAYFGYIGQGMTAWWGWLWSHF